VEDGEEIWSVDKLASKIHTSPDSLEKIIANGECYAARTCNTILGYATFGGFLHEHGFLNVIAVSPDHRRKGVTAALVHYLEEKCPTDKLFTATNRSNKTMQRFAEALGFVRSGQIENIEDNEVELIYMKRLGQSPA
jgi:GNAT superfamily N-acetyltransferase